MSDEMASAKEMADLATQDDKGANIGFDIQHIALDDQE